MGTVGVGRGSWLGFRKRLLVSLALAAAFVVACTTGVTPPLVDDEGPEDSTARLVLASPDPTAIHPLGTDVVFEVESGSLGTDPADVAVFRHGAPVTGATVALDGDRLTVSNALQLGRNDLRVFARDGLGLALAASATVWAGAESLEVSVVDADGFLVADASVTATLVDDPDVRTVVTAAAGTVSIALPVATTALLAVAPDGRRGITTVSGADGFATVVVTAIGTPSVIDNNNFAQGTDGWVLDADDDGTSPVALVAHVPGPLAPSAASAAMRDPGRPGARVGAAGAALRSVSPSSDGTNVDLSLSTAGEGPQTVRRIFETEPATRNVVVRFRFVTDEVPGGYFGSEFNDAYSVLVRSLFGGGLVVLESNSMNGLGLGAFDAAGATAWREVNLPVAPDGDVVEVEISVTNVGDGELDSLVVVDLVREGAVTISEAALHDITGDPLTALSVGPHAYFGGTTRVHGTLTIAGEADDAVTDVTLEVLEGGVVVATGTLAAGARDDLIASFGDDERVRITTSELLFEIPAAGMAAIDTLENGEVALRVRAVTENGASATRDVGAVPKLVRYEGTNRYLGRNETEGGDDWAKPGVAIAIEYFTTTYASDGLLWGDFSNMNGGPLAPHSTHDTGNDVDGFFTGYSSRNATVAATLIEYLNDTSYGSQISLVLVTYSRTAGDAFWNAIKDVELDDGRRARDVILPRADHDGHFHMVLADE